MIRTGSDFSGVGAFDQALDRLGIEQDKVFACDMDKYARQTYIHNYGEPAYYPENVYDREIPEHPLDIYMTSPPCQAFSLAGKRKGETDKRGILFYNSHEFIKKNNPRYFIFENVKGLCSDDNGKTFQRWIDFLAGKTVNGNPVIFPHPESVPYHVYYKVLNAKDFGVPQNRERVFIIGIRDDQDNDFRFPKPFHLVKRLKDVLENEVEEKYFLSDKMVYGLTKCENDFEGRFEPKEKEDIGNCLTARYYKMGRTDNYLKVKSATKNGYEIATDEDSITYSNLNSETKRGRVGKGVSQTIDSGATIAVIAAMRGRNPENSSDRTTGAPTEQRLEINKNGTSNALTTVQKDNLVLYNAPVVKHQLTGGKWDKTHEQSGRVYDENGVSPTIHTMGGGNQEPKTFQNHRIRKLTPRECFRLMDFPDSFTWPVSDTQAYKQAGNSIVVNVLAEIIKNLNL